MPCLVQAGLTEHGELPVIGLTVRSGRLIHFEGCSERPTR